MQADAIMIEELNGANIYRDIGQAFAVLLPVKSVGVMGDCRYAGNIIANLAGDWGGEASLKGWTLRSGVILRAQESLGI